MDKFKVKFLKEAIEFLDKIEEKARAKNITKAKTINDKELFKKLTGEIWEFRTLYNKKQYRLFAFWDKTEKPESIVISTHGLIKTTSKITKSDLDRAESLRKEYFKLKIYK